MSPVIRCSLETSAFYCINRWIESGVFRAANTNKADVHAAIMRCNHLFHVGLIGPEPTMGNKVAARVSGLVKIQQFMTTIIGNRFLLLANATVHFTPNYPSFHFSSALVPVTQRCSIKSLTIINCSVVGCVGQLLLSKSLSDGRKTKGCRDLNWDYWITVFYPSRTIKYRL